jgi:polyisoprenoid-binding protein YceI
VTTAVTPRQLGAGTWAIDPVHSSIGLSVRHLMVTNVRGTFGQFSGVITVAEGGTPSVTAEIAVNSVNTGNEQRDAHLRSADFFDASQFPTATYVSRAVRPNGDNYVLEGDLTLKGVTKPVALALMFNGVNPGMGHGEVTGFEASVVLSRKDFGVGTDMPLDGGGVLVGDKVTVTLQIEAVKQT